MKTTKLDTSGIFQPVTVRAREMEFTLPANSIHIRNNGIEFLSNKPVPSWTELTIDLVSPKDNQKIHCNGIVVGCNGNKHAGYVVSIVFMNLTGAVQEQLSQLAQTQQAQ